MLPLLTVDESLAVDPPEPAYFTGRVRMQNLGAAGGTDQLEYFAVHFDAGAHARPHTHSTDQVLYFVRGTGFVWVAGEERQLAPPGTVVSVPAGLVHMGDRRAGRLPHRRPRPRPGRLRSPSRTSGGSSSVKALAPSQALRRGPARRRAESDRCRLRSSRTDRYRHCGSTRR
jgi:quercetin dioxygenase-like cupin family protein